MNVVSIRCGIIARKLSMSQMFDGITGVVIPITILYAEDNVVVDLVDKGKLGYFSKVGAVNVTQSRLIKPIRGQFKNVNSVYRKVIREFQIAREEKLKIGDYLKVDRYKTGQYINVSGVSSGKGFAGGIKKFNFSGLEATHGVSVKHRSIGSTGQCQDPGKVFKGKKMPGQLGNKKNTVQNIKIIDVDKMRKLIIIKGSVPGKSGSIVVVNDSIKKSLS